MQAVKSILKALGANSSNGDYIENATVHRRVRIQEDSNEVAYTHSKEDYDRSIIETSNDFRPSFSEPPTFNTQESQHFVPGEWADMFLNMGASSYFNSPIKTRA